MYIVFRQKRFIALIIMIVIVIASTVTTYLVTQSDNSQNVNQSDNIQSVIHSDNSQSKNSYIKWVDYKVSLSAMNKAYELDINSYNTEHHYNWIDLLAYVSAKNGGNFKNFKTTNFNPFIEKIKSGQSVEEITKDMKYFSFYKKAYTAVLGGFLGEYYENIDNGDGTTKQVKKYGLIVYSPIAKNFGYSHYDDFGNGRSFGYKRTHLGNDLMGGIGTPIVAVESGYIEVMGWNRYGGWRLGIRSCDGKRSYYYAHLRKNWPYVKTLKEGNFVNAGDVIGYLGMTGYSDKENINNMKVPHLHFGMQLIFDESQKEGSNQIWIDMYNIVKFLSKNKSAVCKNPETREYYANNNKSIIIEKNEKNKNTESISSQ